MKKIAIALALCMALSVVVGGAALAGGKASVQKAPLYLVDGGSSDNVRDDLASQGRVIINDPMGDVALIIQGNVEGLKDNYSYTVWVRELFGYTGPSIHAYPPYYKLDTFTTNSKGKGHFHLNILATDLPSGTYDIQVAINDPVGVFGGVIGETVLATVKYTEVTVGS